MVKLTAKLFPSLLGPNEFLCLHRSVDHNDHDYDYDHDHDYDYDYMIMIISMIMIMII